MDPNNSGIIPAGVKRGREAMSDSDAMNISDDETATPIPAQPTAQNSGKPVSFTFTENKKQK